MTKNVEFATFTQTVMITTVLLITGSLLNMSKTGSGINILYLLMGPIGHYSGLFILDKNDTDLVRIGPPLSGPAISASAQLSVARRGGQLV